MKKIPCKPSSRKKSPAATGERKKYPTPYSKGGKCCISQKKFLLVFETKKLLDAVGHKKIPAPKKAPIPPKKGSNGSTLKVRYLQSLLVSSELCHFLFSPSFRSWLLHEDPWLELLYGTDQEKIVSVSILDNLRMEGGGERGGA